MSPRNESVDRIGTRTRRRGARVASRAFSRQYVQTIYKDVRGMQLVEMAVTHFGRPASRYLLATGLLACANACDYARDAVAPGFYGEIIQAGRSATSESASRPTAGAAAQGGAGSGPSAPIGYVSVPQTATGGALATGTAGSAAPAAACDLSGPWLVTMHKTTDALGNQQTAHNYVYYELVQQGDAVSVSKGLMCGLDAFGGGSFSVSVDFSAAWPGIMKNVVLAGRKGTSVRTASGCKVDFDKEYIVFGATLPHYLDPAFPVPSAEEHAAVNVPGWEDWDEDGHPGITGVCSGTVVGKIFSAAREWTQLSGTAPDVRAGFTLPLSWDSEPNVMAFDGSPFLGSSAVRAADASLHFVQFARLQPGQAVGDDAAICKAVVALAPTLTPEAAAM